MDMNKLPLILASFIILLAVTSCGESDNFVQVSYGDETDTHTYYDTVNVESMSFYLTKVSSNHNLNVNSTITNNSVNESYSFDVQIIFWNDYNPVANSSLFHVTNLNPGELISGPSLTASSNTTLTVNVKVTNLIKTIRVNRG